MKTNEIRVSKGGSVPSLASPVSVSIVNGGMVTKILLPLRAVGKLYAMLGKCQEFESYDGTIRTEGEKVFSEERIEKEIV